MTQTEIIQILAGFVGSFGFAILFHIRGKRRFLAALGGLLSWLLFVLLSKWIESEPVVYFVVACVISVYAEIMARVRKYPAISYLVVAIFPLIPGAGIYYTTSFLLQGDRSAFAQKALQTICIAGVIAVGILMVSTLVRLWSSWQQKRR